MPNRLAGGPQSSSDDLYTKIALDNKLITRYHLRQASKEQEDLSEAGQSVPLGAVLVRMGFLTEGQHQSVINACRYREQRDYDKRFARQILRMELLTQSSIEESLELQKRDYGQSGVVAPLADGLENAGKLSPEQVESVHKGIQQRDKSRGKPGGAGASPLAVSGPTPVLTPRNGEDDPTVEGSPLARRRPTQVTGDVDLDDVDLDDIDADLDDADLDDEDLDDVDLDDLDDADLDDADLDDADLDDADLDDVDLDDVDLDDLDDEDLDDLDLDDLDDADLDDADLDDEDLDEAGAGLDSDLASVADLDDDELDDMGSVADLDDDELELGSVANLESEPRLDADLDDIDLDDLDLDGLDDGESKIGELDEDESDLAALNLDDLDEDSLEAGSSDVGEDEDDLAQVASELDSEVQLTDEDIKAIEELGSAEELEGAVGWAAEAFDDRPLGQRPPSERMPVASSRRVAPPAAPPLPRRPEAPNPPAQAPRAPVAAAPGVAKRQKTVPAGSVAKRPSGIPGGSVFDENLSDMGKTEASPAQAEQRAAPAQDERTGPPTDMGLVEEFGDLVESADIAPESEHGSEDLLEPSDAPSEERRAMIESAVTSAVERTLASSEDKSMPQDSASPGFDPSDPKVRAAFERAVEDAVRQALDTAFDSFLKELRQGGA